MTAGLCCNFVGNTNTYNMGVTNYSGGVQVVEEATFVRSLNVTTADFDGTDTANVATALKTQETNGSHFNPWKKNGGFKIKPASTGTVQVLMWEDYLRNGKVVDDTLAQTISVTGDQWAKDKVVKVYSASTVKTMDIGTVL